MKVLLISGSARPHSFTTAAVRTIAGILESKGHEARVWDLGQEPLPFADPAHHNDPKLHPDPRVKDLVAAAVAAEAIVLASPVYHNAYTGLLKNCLDLLSMDQFAYKPVGLVAHGSTFTAVQVCDQMRIVVRGLYGLAIPSQVVTTPEFFDGDRNAPGKKLVDPGILKRVEGFCKELSILGRKA